jgi:hypothetical protein
MQNIRIKKCTWKQPQWSHFNIIHGIQILFCFYFCFIDCNLYNCLIFFLIIQISSESYMYKGWEGANVKVPYEFNNDPIKNVFSM